MRGEDHVLKFVKQNYYSGNSKIQVLSEDKKYGGWKMWCTLTTNIPFLRLDKNMAYLDIQYCPREIIDWIFRNNYAKKINQREEGIYLFPLVEFSEEFMNTVLNDIYLFEAHYINMATHKNRKASIEIGRNLITIDKQAYVYAMDKAYDMREDNESLSSVELIAC